MRPERKAALTRQPLERVLEWRWRVWRWSQRRRRLMLTVAGGGLLVLVAWGMASLVWRSQTAGGLAALRAGLAARAADELAPAARDGAIRHFETAAARLNGRPRQLALWHLGHAYQQQQEFEHAAQAYHAVVADAPAGDHYLVQLAWLKLGEVAEQEGDLQLAQSRYLHVAQIDGPTQAQAVLALATLFEKANDPEQAQSYYRQFMAVAADSPLKELVELKLE